MPIHVVDSTQIVSASLADCWRFFSDPRNLARITPPALRIEILGDLPKAIYAGLLIQYRVRPLLGIPTTWLTEITHVEERVFFVDQQALGPYRLWHHEHRFRALDDRSTEMRDIIHYVLPYGWLGEIAHPWLVAPQLRRIFEFRERTVKEIFKAASANCLRSAGKGSAAGSGPPGRWPRRDGWKGRLVAGARRQSVPRFPLGHAAGIDLAFRSERFIGKKDDVRIDQS
jgi:ligand-binding SRPBCC domain-containing protein